MNYHRPVLLKETIDGLNIKPHGVYIDATYGFGGHSKSILDRLDYKGRLFAFDCDFDTSKHLIDHPSYVFVQSNFRYISNFMDSYNISQADGILADFGVSSYQIDTPTRGFSYQRDGKLDMRMNQNQTLTAFEVINHYDTDALSKVFYQYGELIKARKIAEQIVISRSQNEINTTFDLKEILSSLLGKGRENKTLAKIFQAIRIEVNQELDAIKIFLKQCAKLLKPAGRLVCISYHSLEDRLVKFFIQTGNFSNQPIKDFYGNVIKPLNKVGKLIRPSAEEINQNPRARSAKLRIAEKR